jgi:hypothetical protein
MRRTVGWMRGLTVDVMMVLLENKKPKTTDRDLGLWVLDLWPL